MNKTNELLLVALAVEGESTGYDLSKIVKPFINTAHQFIYKELNKMAEEGLLNCEYVPQDSKPDKKVYSLTQKGTDAYLASLGNNHVSDFSKTAGAARYGRLALLNDFGEDSKDAYIKAMESAETKFFKGLE